MAKGFVYVLSNAAQGGLLKIGYTRKVPHERAAELNSTGVAEPFEVEFYCLVDGDAEAESQVHAALASYRHRQDREFFRVEIEDAISAILKVCKTPEHTWSRKPAEATRSRVTSDYTPTRPEIIHGYDPRIAKPQQELDSTPTNSSNSMPTAVHCPCCKAEYRYATFCPQCHIDLPR